MKKKRKENSSKLTFLKYLNPSFELKVSYLTTDSCYQIRYFHSNGHTSCYFFSLSDYSFVKLRRFNYFLISFFKKCISQEVSLQDLLNITYAIV